MSFVPVEESYDVVVVGAGHAGCEAALACARLGLSTIMFTVSCDSIALMPCNPNIGGSSKGHLVRELDALGGEMGKVIDKTFLQSKMLNVSRGPAVHSLRAQADKQAYSNAMRRVLEKQERLVIRQQEVSEILYEKIHEESNIDSKIESSFRIYGVRTVSGASYYAKAVILATGVYLSSCCIYGDVRQNTGPNGLMAANHLSASLRAMGIRLVRFKTGTPARISKASIDFSKMSEQKGDERVVPFSFSTDPDTVQIEQMSCYLTYTNETTHDIIRRNIDRSPLYAGVIHATGPRYCPSIEDKVMKFADKDRHQVFIEPEGRYTDEMYIDGMSSSMPEDVQFAMYRSVPGLEHAHIVRNAYAIEYDCLAYGQLKNTLEFRRVEGLFSAGQFNGSSGYEEAAAQGLMAGINASMKIKKRDPLVLLRSEAYIGVLIDDLVTRENLEPYRMMTSRAEYRLLLRQDNADLRLRKYGHAVGLVSDEVFKEVLQRQALINREIERMENQTLPPSDALNDFLINSGSTPIQSGAVFAELIRRPEITYEALGRFDPERPDIPSNAAEQVNIEIKYAGYIKRQLRQIENFEKFEHKMIPETLDYDAVKSLRIEARQKLKAFRPSNIGQASRLAGVTPADIAVLIVYLRQNSFASSK